jgi:hypothetical protein
MNTCLHKELSYTGGLLNYHLKKLTLLGHPYLKITTLQLNRAAQEAMTLYTILPSSTSLSDVTQADGQCDFHHPSPFRVQLRGTFHARHPHYLPWGTGLLGPRA